MPNKRKELLSTLDILIFGQEIRIKKVMMVDFFASVSVWVFEMCVELLPKIFLVRWQLIVSYHFDTVSVSLLHHFS